jgi:hypothetical protein
MTESATRRPDELAALRGLGDLRAAGWLFVPVTEDGAVVELRGLRTWPHGWMDVLLLRDVSDAAGVRADPGGRIRWRREGSLSEVIDGLLVLPAPRLWTA